MTENKRAKRSAADPQGGRLAPGELDKLVLGYMRRHKKDAPHTASAIGKAIKRSSGRWPTASAARRSRRRCGW